MRMHPKPKSAPPSIQSKFMANKSNAMKEMEAWIKKDADPLTSNFEASRMSGQLVDNVTEERMLKAKLWELSKERYKFLSQTAYEKKVFMDRMHRKSGIVTRELLVRRPSLEHSDSSVFSFQSTSSGKCLNARQAFLERMDPGKRRDRPREIRNLEEQERERKVSFPPRNLVTEIIPKSKVNSNRHSVVVGATQKTAVTKRLDSPMPPVCSENIQTMPGVVSTATAVAAASTTLMGNIGLQPLVGVKTWAQKRPPRKYGSTTRSMTSDPRYCHLEHALTPMKMTPTPSHLTDVVSNIDCLHQPPKTQKETKKTKIGDKAFGLMKERGFTF